MSTRVVAQRSEAMVVDLVVIAAIAVSVVGIVATVWTCKFSRSVIKVVVNARIWCKDSQVIALSKVGCKVDVAIWH